MKKQKVMIPQYIKDFQCIGSKCEDNCCIGWKVILDHKTYNKYKKLSNDDLTPLIKKYVKRNRTVTSSDVSYAKINNLSNHRCPFLNENKLCRIQIGHGEDYLSDVCTTYPKNTHIVNNTIERSATMSCPEAARLALLNKNGIEFDEEELPYKKDMVRSTLDTHDIKLKYKPMKFFWELRIFSISLVQNRNYLLWERLVILGMFYQKLQEYIDNKKIEDIPQLIAKYTNLIEKNFFKESLNEIPVKNNIQMKILKELTDVRFKSVVTSGRYIQCFTEFLHGLKFTKEATIEEIGLRYDNAWKLYLEPFILEHEYILENYIVNHIFKNLIPFSEVNGVFDSYLMMILHYSLIKMHLIGISGFHKKMDINIAIKLIQSFAKTVEHSQQYLNMINELIKNSGFNTMAYMTILIKN